MKTTCVYHKNMTCCCRGWLAADEMECCCRSDYAQCRSTCVRQSLIHSGFETKPVTIAEKECFYSQSFFGHDSLL